MPASVISICHWELQPCQDDPWVGNVGKGPWERWKALREQSYCQSQCGIMEGGSIVGIFLSVGGLSGRAPEVAMNEAQHLQCSQGSNIGLDLFGWEERPLGLPGLCSLVTSGTVDGCTTQLCQGRLRWGHKRNVFIVTDAGFQGAHTSVFGGHLENALSIPL